MTAFKTIREIPATMEQVFGAISNPERLARWWGPAGFTNTFKVCEFRNGGRWSFTMHGPNGANYPNESVFAEIEPQRKVVVQHVSEPKFRLAIVLTASARGTVVSWSQEFDDSKVARRLEQIVVPANEQNLDRLSAEVLGEARSNAPFDALIASLRADGLDSEAERLHSLLHKVAWTTSSELIGEIGRAMKETAREHGAGFSDGTRSKMDAAFKVVRRVWPDFPK
jgi:uncharacterized protein YndB with AHSA1/START domain